MEDGTKTKTVLAQLGINFWNKIAAVVLGYGGIMTLAMIEIDRATGALSLLGQFDNYSPGAIVIVLAFGTLGLYVLRDRVFEPKQWVPARRVAIALNGVLAVASVVAENIALVSVCLMILVFHVVLPRLIQE